MGPPTELAHSHAAAGRPATSDCNRSMTTCGKPITRWLVCPPFGYGFTRCSPRTTITVLFTVTVLAVESKSPTCNPANSPNRRPITEARRNIGASASEAADTSLPTGLCPGGCEQVGAMRNAACLCLEPVISQDHRAGVVQPVDAANVLAAVVYQRRQGRGRARRLQDRGTDAHGCNHSVEV